jgi:hypothetical protein
MPLAFTQACHTVLAHSAYTRYPYPSVHLHEIPRLPGSIKSRARNSHRDGHSPCEDIQEARVFFHSASFNLFARGSLRGGVRDSFRVCYCWLLFDDRYDDATFPVSAVELRLFCAAVLDKAAPVGDCRLALALDLLKREERKENRVT